MTTPNIPNNPIIINNYYFGSSMANDERYAWVDALLAFQSNQYALNAETVDEFAENDLLQERFASADQNLEARYHEYALNAETVDEFAENDLLQERFASADQNLETMYYEYALTPENCDEYQDAGLLSRKWAQSNLFGKRKSDEDHTDEPELKYLKAEEEEEDDCLNKLADEFNALRLTDNCNYDDDDTMLTILVTDPAAMEIEEASAESITKWQKKYIVAEWFNKY